MREAGLSIREDAVGNIFGLLAGDGSAGDLLACTHAKALVTPAFDHKLTEPCCKKLAHHNALNA